MNPVSDIAAACARQSLMVAGTVAEGNETIVLLAPDEPGFWTTLQDSPEWRDGKSDPVDRWSKRVIGAIAKAVGGEAIFPSDGPPYPPFYRWACNSGRIWASPVTLLVHDTAGLFISFRGAIRISGTGPAGATQRPCETCGRPCLTACPALALTGAGYDLARCHAYLDTRAGQDCRANGCLVRRACPVGQGRRLPAQSAYHMSLFHP